MVRSAFKVTDPALHLRKTINDLSTQLLLAVQVADLAVVVLRDGVAALVDRAVGILLREREAAVRIDD